MTAVSNPNKKPPRAAIIAAESRTLLFIVGMLKNVILIIQKVHSTKKAGHLHDQPLNMFEGSAKAVFP
jgi:hypothetical protein